MDYKLVLALVILGSCLGSLSGVLLFHFYMTRSLYRKLTILEIRIHDLKKNLGL